MTRIARQTPNHAFRRAATFLSAAFLALALLAMAAPTASAGDAFASCDKVKFGASGQCYTFKDGC